MSVEPLPRSTSSARLRAHLLHCVLALLGVASPATQALPAELLIEHARIVDGSDGHARIDKSILIRAGRIVEIDSDVVAGDGARTLDATGLTVLPGLIDSHVHLASVPGALLRNDPPELTTALLDHHLRAYLASGVTTILDAAIPVELAEKVRGRLDAGLPAPRVLFLSPALTSPGGYAADAAMGIGFEPVSTPEDVEARFLRSRSAAPVGVKVFIESGMGPSAKWPIHSPAMRKAIVRTAARHRMPIYVHASSEQDQSIAVDLPAHALVHPGFLDGPPSSTFLSRLSEQGTYVMTTLAIQDSLLAAWDTSRLDAPLVQRVVPSIEIDTARQPNVPERLFPALVGQALPTWIPPWLHSTIARLLISEERLEGSLATAQASVLRFHEAGIPLVLGSDSGNWPLIPYLFHGPSTIRKAELLEEAGLSPAEVLRAATAAPARMLGIAEEVGAVQPGQRADLIIVRDDPLRHIGALRSIEWVIRNGVARTPTDWMTAPEVRSETP